MLKIVFLCSGGGGNLRFIAEAIRLGFLGDAALCGVITDRECAASTFAKQQNIPTLECDFALGNQLGLVKELANFDPGIIVTNVHRILSTDVVKSFKGKLINLHYSLLPAFGGVIGAKAVSKALDYGVQLVGTTVHFVDDLVDAGSPVVQAAIPVMQGDDVPSLMDIVFRVGCISLFEGILLSRPDKQGPLAIKGSILEVAGRSALFSPGVTAVPDFQDETFWRRLK
jgi:phosphoribosylglycinamide formyltransferase 1